MAFYPGSPLPVFQVILHTVTFQKVSVPWVSAQWLPMHLGLTQRPVYGLQDATKHAPGHFSSLCAASLPLVPSVSASLTFLILLLASALARP